MGVAEGAISKRHQKSLHTSNTNLAGQYLPVTLLHSAWFQMAVDI